MRRIAPALCCLVAVAVVCPRASADTARSFGPSVALTSTITSGARAASTSARTSTSEAPVPVLESNIAPPGRRLSSDQVLQIARSLPKMKALQKHNPGSFADAYLKGPERWQVSFFTKKGAKEIGLVIIADSTGRVLEQWTGFQVIWTMARGYPGAFGRHVNALYIWLPLCLLFMLPFIDPRRPLSLLHLDLLVLLSFSVSLAFFNHANIYASVPLTYPPLLYLLARMLWLALGPAWRGRRRAEIVPAASSRLEPPSSVAEPERLPGAPGIPPLGTAELQRGEPGIPPLGIAGLEPPRNARELGRARPTPGLRLLLPVPWLAVGVMFLLGFRIALNMTDSNVIDVGYAGVIGADKVVHGKALYGGWPSENEHGDTYGPVNYEAYVPFEQAFGWSGTWDDLPAAHAAAIAFDLLALGLIFLLGLRIRGPTLGTALAYAWVSYPFTLFTLESNSNDTLVAVFILAALLFATSPPARGAFAALAGLTKFAPLALAPVLATHGLRELPARRRARAMALFLLAFVLVAAIVSVPALTHDSLHEIYERTIAYQSDRGSPFSVWGLYGWHGLELAVEVAAIALALVLAAIPRRGDVIGLAAACAAILIAIQLSLEHWFYLYIPWFFPLVMLALLGSRALPAAGRPVAVTPTAGVPALASEPARSTPLAAAWRSSG